MTRSLALALALGCAAQATASGVLGVIECVESCADDRPDGSCAPDCHDCVCCTAPRSTAPIATSLFVLPPPTTQRVAYLERGCPSPVTDDILRIPIALLS